MNKWTCPAKFKGDWASASNVTAASADFSTDDWWCSDGTFNLTNNANRGIA